MNKINLNQIDGLNDSLTELEEKVDAIDVSKYVTIDTPQNVDGAKTFRNITALSRAMQLADKKLYSFYANPLPSVWESTKLDIAEPNQFRKFDTNYIDISASLTDDGDDWDPSLIRSINSKPLLTSVDGTAYVQARIRENNVPYVRRVKLEITCDPTSGQVSGENSRMWLTNLCILGNTSRGTHKMKIDLYKDSVWTNFMNDQTDSKSAEFIDHVAHSQINFGTGANAADYTIIRIIFYDFKFLPNVQATSDFQLRKIWWFGPYPNKINKVTHSEDLDGNFTFTGSISSGEGKLATESYVNEHAGDKNQNAFSVISTSSGDINADLPASTLQIVGEGATNVSVEGNVLTINTVQSEANVVDISNMFTANTDADVSAFMFKRENGRHLIRIHGFDNTGLDDDLTIIPALGFGPHYSSYQATVQTIDGVNFQNYGIKIEREIDTVQGSLFIPHGVQTFDTTYYLHDGTNKPSSYYIDTNNVMHPFSLANTPIENFCGNPGSLIINDVSVSKSDIKEIVFGDDYLGITTIPDTFLYNTRNITQMNLSGLRNVTSVGYAFLNYNLGLTSLDLSFLANATSIGGMFFGFCSNLTTLDLLPLTKVTSIGNDFLSRCGSLQFLDLTSLSQITSVGNRFLFSCSSLKTLDTSPLVNLTTVGYDFLQFCSSLESINLIGLKNVTAVGERFMSTCTNLQSIDLTPLSNLTTLSASMLGSCFSLTELDLTPFSNVTIIESSVFANCIGLTSLDLSPLSNVTQIKGNFLIGCTGLTQLDLNPLGNTTMTGNGFLRNCTGLTSLDLSPLSHLTLLDINFLKGCTGLTHLDLTPLNKIEAFRTGCFSDCTGLLSLDISKNNLNQVEIGFLNNCTSLNEIIIGDIDWTNVTVDPEIMVNVPNTTDCQICTTSYDLGLTFKNKMNGHISNWTILEISHYVDTNDVIHYFDIANTLINNFSNDTSTITINGEVVDKTAIKEIRFSPRYLTVNGGLGANFLKDCTSLVYLDFEGLNNSFPNSDYFLSGCSNLETIESFGFNSNAEHIGNWFMEKCSKLTSIDLTSLVNLIEIRQGFLSECSGLTYFDFSIFKNLQKVGSNCLSSCLGLTSVNLTGLERLTSTPNGFLNGSLSLTSLDLTPLSNITELSTNFLTTSGLITLDLSPLDKVQTIGLQFLSNCTKLTSLNLSLPNLISVGYSFMYNCTSLREINVQGVDWTNKVVNAQGLLANVPNTTDCTIYADTLDLGLALQVKMDPHLSNWIIIERPSTSYCVDTNGVRYEFSLADTPIENLCGNGSEGGYLINGQGILAKNVEKLVLGYDYQNVTAIPDSFLSWVVNATSIDVRNLVNVESIGNHFLGNTNSLIDLKINFSKVKTIGQSVIYDVYNLTSIDLSTFKSLESISVWFMRRSRSLTSINIGNINWNNITGYETGYFYENPNTTSCIIYADTEELGTIFKTKVGANISNWAIVVNS